MNGARQYLALVICFVVGTAVLIGVLSLMRVVQPGSELVRRDRLPPTWHRLTGWARSRSLRLWCPDAGTAARVADHLRGETGRRLRRLGVSVVDVPALADVVVADRGDGTDVDAARAMVPVPCASIVLTDAGDVREFASAVVALSATLRWPDRVEPC